MSSRVEVEMEEISAVPITLMKWAETSGVGD